MEEPKEVFIEWGPEPPDGYGEDRIVLMVRDPEAFAFYWDVSEPDAEHVARIICLSQARHYDIPLPKNLNVWYVPAEPNQTYRAELLRRGPDGELRPVAVSREGALPVLHAWQADAKPAELVHAEQEPISRSKQAAPAEAVWPGSSPAPPPPEYRDGPTTFPGLPARPSRSSGSSGSSDYVNFGQEA